MIENEYVVDKNRYYKWTTPKFYALPIFYIYICIFIFAILGLWYFIKNGLDKKWILLLGFVALCTFYLAIFHKWITCISQYKLIKKKAFNGKVWKQKIVVNDKSIDLYVNDELSNSIKWNEITKVAVAKSFVSLKKNFESEKINLYNDSYVKGSPEELLDFIKRRHSDICICKERFRYNI